MFGPVVTTGDHLAFSGARTHSNNTAEMTAMIEALSFLGSHGPVARDEQSCIYYDSLHAAGVCLGHDPDSYTCATGTRMSTRPCCAPNTGFDSPCNMCMVTVVILEMNECTDHAAAPGTLGFTSSHIVTTRLIHHNFDATACFDGCHSIQRIRTDTVSLFQHRI